MDRITEYMSMFEMRGKRIGCAYLEVYEIGTEDEEAGFTCITCGRKVNKGIMSVEYTSTRGVRVYVICHDCFYSPDESIIDRIF